LGLGLGLSAAYLLPAAIEQDLIRSDHIAQQYPYHDSYVLLFLRPNPDHYYAYLHLVDRMWILGLLVILVVAVIMLAFKPRAVRADTGLRRHILSWLILGCFASFMMTAASKPLGLLLPKIEIGVFAWRMLSVVTLVEALLIGACAHAAFTSAKQGRKHEFAFLGALALWIFLGNIGFSWEEVVKPSYNSPAFVPATEHLNLAMQPRTSHCDIFKLPVVEPATLAGGKGHVSVEKWEPEHRAIEVELSEPDHLLIRTFNFPGWTAAVDGEAADIINGRALRVQADGAEESVIRDLSYAGLAPEIEGKPVKVLGELQLGDIIIELPPGAHRVTLDYVDTPARRLAEILTLFSACALAALLFTPPVLRSRH
jgi:hypothetical protein